MKLWGKLDLFGRSLVLFSIAFQLTIVSEIQSSKVNGDIFYLMENQTWMALMLNNISSSKSKDEIANENSSIFGNITLYSEWDKSRIHEGVRQTNIIFIIIFLIGSILIIVGRMLEIKDSPAINKVTNN